MVCVTVYKEEKVKENTGARCEERREIQLFIRPVIVLHRNHHSIKVCPHSCSLHRQV